MIVYQEAALRSLVEDTLNSILKERFILKELHSYMTSKNDRKACCLYGLRRTGKTIMALQEIGHLDDYKNSIFIMCENGDSIHQVKDVMKANPSCKYLFIDEATKASDFIDTSAFLADAYAMRGVKVVLFETDTLGFYLAKNEELYDRMHLLHTTYIPFKEYNFLLGKDLDDYIRYGGTLTESGTKNTFYNKETSEKYSNTAIVYNIIHSLDNWNDGINYAYQVLRPVTEDKELASFINKVIEYPTREFLAGTINAAFEDSHDLRHLCKILRKADIEDKKQLKQFVQEQSEIIQDVLGIKEKHINEAPPNTVEAIIKYLKEMDVLYEIPKQADLDEIPNTEYIFTQVGMRYCQAANLAEMLTKSEKFGKGFDIESRNQILQKLDEIIRGGLLEDVVFSQIAKANDNLSVSKYRNITGQEIDILVLDKKSKTTFAIEVNHSDKAVDEQRKHLTNAEFCAEIEQRTGMPIANKAVVYRGNNGESEDGVLYINASDFLIRSQEMLNVLLTHCNIKTFEELEYLMKNSA